MFFELSSVIVGIALLVIAYLVYTHAGGRGSRTIGLLSAIIGLIGLYMILVRGIGLISLG